MITLIATVLNEGENIHDLMHTIQMQTRPADEVLIVDGGSTDNTLSALESYRTQLPLKVLIQDGCNISEGRNTAIEHASFDIIATTDAGVRLAPDWLEKIVVPLEQDPHIGVAAGFFQADPKTVFEAALAATTLPHVSEIKPDHFLPSSRSIAFRREIALAIGAYPEWLDYCEDLIFDLRLKKITNFAFVPDAIAHFRPRTSLRSYFKQYYLYARGDGKADLWRKRHLIRYLTYLVALPAIFCLGILVHPICWLAYLLGGFIYLRAPYSRLAANLALLEPKPSRLDKLYAILSIPFLRLVGDVAKMLAYPVGWYWRLKNHPPNWKD